MFSLIAPSGLLLAVCASSATAEPAKPAKYTCPMHAQVVSTTAGTCPDCKMKLVEKAVYVCPMHPEVTSDKPGKCGKCKMALVKKTGGKPITK